MGLLLDGRRPELPSCCAYDDGRRRLCLCEFGWLVDRVSIQEREESACALSVADDDDDGIANARLAAAAVRSVQSSRPSPRAASPGSRGPSRQRILVGSAPALLPLQLACPSSKCGGGYLCSSSSGGRGRTEQKRAARGERGCFVGPCMHTQGASKENKTKGQQAKHRSFVFFFLAQQASKPL